MKKRAGFSHTLIQVNNEVHTMLVIGDQHHPQIDSSQLPFSLPKSNAIIPRREKSRGIALGCVNMGIINPILYTKCPFNADKRKHTCDHRAILGQSSN